MELLYSYIVKKCLVNFFLKTYISKSFKIILFKIGVLDENISFEKKKEDKISLGSKLLIKLVRDAGNSNNDN